MRIYCLLVVTVACHAIGCAGVRHTQIERQPEYLVDAEHSSRVDQLKLSFIPIGELDVRMREQLNNYNSGNQIEIMRQWLEERKGLAEGLSVPWCTEYFKLQTSSDDMLRDMIEAAAGLYTEELESAIQTWCNNLVTVINFSDIRIDKANQDIRQKNLRVDRQARGIRFLQPSPYLLVYADGNGGLNWEIHYLPDPTRAMSAQPYNYFATLKAKLEFSNKGFLTKATETATGSAIPSAIVKAVGEIAPKFLGLLNSKDRTIPTPHLYKIVILDGGDVRFIGGQGRLDHIRVTYIKPENGE